MTIRRGPNFIPAFISVLVSLGCMRSGFLGLFFLVPLGVAAFGYDLRTAWFTVVCAVIGNGIVVGGMALLLGYAPGDWGADILYFSAMVVLFGWITAPPSGGPRFLRIRTAYRILAGSLAGALVFLPLFVALRHNPGFYAFIKTQLETVSSLYASSGGADVVRRSLLEQITPDIVLDFLEFMLVRGGGVVSCVLFFFLSRQMALMLTWIIRRRHRGGNLSGFHVAPGIIWVLSGSLFAVLLGTWTKAAPLEIIAWNTLVLCIILYLAQGGGIVLFFLNRFAIPPGLRVIFNIIFFFGICNPGLSPFILGILILVGIAENWAPLRVQKSKDPSSTPRIGN
jgi:hypothetical protein